MRYVGREYMVPGDKNILTHCLLVNSIDNLLLQVILVSLIVIVLSRLTWKHMGYDHHMLNP